MNGKGRIAWRGKVCVYGGWGGGIFTRHSVN